MVMAMRANMERAGHGDKTKGGTKQDRNME